MKRRSFFGAIFGSLAAGAGTLIASQPAFRGLSRRCTWGFPTTLEPCVWNSGSWLCYTPARMQKYIVDETLPILAKDYYVTEIRINAGSVVQVSFGKHKKEAGSDLDIVLNAPRPITLTFQRPLPGS